MRTSLGPSTRRAEGHARLSPQGAPAADPKKKKAPVSAGAWEEARALIWKHRQRLALGLALMIVNRLAGLVLPMTSKYLMDDVIGQQQLGPAAEAGDGRRRRDDRRRGDARSPTRRCSASPRSAPSPRCARTSRRT